MRLIIKLFLTMAAVIFTARHSEHFSNIEDIFAILFWLFIAVLVFIKFKEDDNG